MKLTNTKIERYEVDIYYYVDVVIDSVNDVYDAWLHHKDYGTSLYMFGSLISQVSKEHFLELVEANLEDYISCYICDVIDKDEDFDEE